MALRDTGTLLVGGFLVLLVVTVIRVDDVAEFADLVLEVDGADFGVIEMCSCRQMRSMRGSSGISGEVWCGVGGYEYYTLQLLAELREGVLQFICEAGHL